MSKKNKSAKAKLIANPGSGTSSDRGKLLEQVTRCLEDQGVKVDVVVAKPHEKAVPITRKAVKDGYKIIIAMGGDDTIEAVIRGMAGSKARLGMIPVGTSNNLAKGLGIPTEVEQACAIIAKGNVRKLDLGEVSVGKKKKNFPFFELVMVGIGAAVYTDGLRMVKGKKPFASLKGVVQKVIKHDSKPRVTIQMDGESDVSVDSMLAIVSNVPLIGPNMLIDPESSSEDGYFDVSVYPNFSKADLLAYFGKATISDEAVENGKIQRYRAQKIKIVTKPKQEVNADGVMLGKGKVKIKMHHGALRVIAPEVGAGVEKPPEEANANLPAPVAPLPENNNKNEEKVEVLK